MPGYYFAVAHCFCCGRQFTFNPDRVPSLTYGGTRRPICKNCVDLANPRREAAGLPAIVPLKGAYDLVQEGREDDFDGA